MNRKVLMNLLVVTLLIGGIITGIFAVQQMTNYLSFASQNAGQPLNVLTRVIGPDQAVISWSSDDAVISLVQYGPSPTEMNETQTELSSVRTHRVTLTNLTPDTTYYYKIQVGQEVYDNEGVPWEFVTPAADKTPKLTEQEFRQLYGTTDERFDYNEDGVVNGFDYQLYLQQ